MVHGGATGLGTGGLVGRVVPATIAPSRPSTSTLHETPRTRAPGPHAFSQDAPVTQGNSPAAERGWWWPPWTGPGTCSQPLGALRAQTCARLPSGQRRRGHLNSGRWGGLTGEGSFQVLMELWGCRGGMGGETMGGQEACRRLRVCRQS